MRVGGRFRFGHTRRERPSPWCDQSATPHSQKAAKDGAPSVWFAEGWATRRSGTVSAVREATSRKAREMAHPKLFRSMSKNRSALYFAVKVAHPPPPVVSVDIKKTNPRSTSPLKCPTRSPHSHGVDQ